jgi:hypothetical protein
VDNKIGTAQKNAWILKSRAQKATDDAKKLSSFSSIFLSDILKAGHKRFESDHINSKKDCFSRSEI